MEKQMQKNTLTLQKHCVISTSGTERSQDLFLKQDQNPSLRSWDKLENQLEMNHRFCSA